MFYAAKYVGKLADPDNADAQHERVGRWWGVLGRQSMPFGARVVLRLLGSEPWQMRRMLARLMRRRVRGWKGLTAFADSDQWERWIIDAHFWTG